MTGQANSINESTTGIVGFTGTAFTATPVTNHAVILGSSTSSALGSVGPTATAGQVLQSAGSSTDPLFSTATYPTDAAVGDLIYGSATHVFSSLAISSIPGSRLEYNGTNVAWFNPLQETILFEDWIATSVAGNLNWRNGTSNSGTIAIGSNVDSGHPGVVTMGTSTTTNGQAYLLLGQNSSAQPMILGGGAVTIIWIVQIPTLSTAVDEFAVACGLSANQSGGTTLGNGCGFLYNDNGSLPNWQVYSSAGTPTQNDTGVAAVAGSWYHLRMDVNAGASSIAFTINEASVTGSPISTHIPTQAISPYCTLGKVAGTTNRSLYIDTFYTYQKLTSAR